MRTCHVLLAYVTPKLPNSWWDQEVGSALGRCIPVIPVNAGLQPYGFFGSVQSLPADARPSLALAIFRAIAVSCFRGPSPPGAAAAPTVAQTIVQAFCLSGSYESTRQRFPFLELIPAAHWTDEMISELELATDNNEQIYEAGLRTPRQPAPGAVRELVARLRQQRSGSATRS